MLPHALTEGEIPFVRSANGNGTEFHFRLFLLSKFLKVPFPFVSVKTNFESSIKISFLLMALCFRVNPYLTAKLKATLLPKQPMQQSCRTPPDVAYPMVTGGISSVQDKKCPQLIELNAKY